MAKMMMMRGRTSSRQCLRLHFIHSRKAKKWNESHSKRKHSTFCIVKKSETHVLQYEGARMNVLTHGSRPERWVIPLHFNPYPAFTLAHDRSFVGLASRIGGSFLYTASEISHERNHGQKVFRPSLFFILDQTGTSVRGITRADR